jgi:hypothetical protein
MNEKMYSSVRNELGTCCERDNSVWSFAFPYN